MHGYPVELWPIVRLSIDRDDDGKKKKKRKIEDNEVEALFSKKRSQQWIDEESTPLLPIKDKRKIIQRAQKIEQPESGPS